jgi:hypothetical protein
MQKQVEVARTEATSEAKIHGTNTSGSSFSVDVEVGEITARTLDSDSLWTTFCFTYKLTD